MIAHWGSIYDAIYRLWLDSGSYEEWARSQLADINSAVNEMGRKAQRALNVVRRCYYRFFQDESADEFKPSRVCPACDGALRPYPDGIFDQGLCDSCSILIFTSVPVQVTADPPGANLNGFVVTGR